MIGRVLALGLAGAATALVLDRALAARSGDHPPEPIRTMVVVDAPRERVWAELLDIEGQPRWMREMKSVRLLSTGPVAAGTRAEAEVRILGIRVVDPVTVVEVLPPTRYSIRHEGLFKGGGVIELEAGADGTSTIVTWSETLVPPFLPSLAGIVQRPVLERVFQADLHLLRELLEGPGAASPSEPSLEGTVPQCSAALPEPA